MDCESPHPESRVEMDSVQATAKERGAHAVMTPLRTRLMCVLLPGQVRDGPRRDPERPKEMPPLCGCEYWQTQKIGEQGAIQCQHDECRGLGATRGSTHAFVLHAVTLAQWVEKCWIFRSCREQRCAHLLHLVVGHRFHGSTARVGSPANLRS